MWLAFAFASSFLGCVACRVAGGGGSGEREEWRGWREWRNGGVRARGITWDNPRVI